jgi:hypothetical protein
MSRTVAIIVLGAALAAMGFVFGVLPAHRAGVSCGSAFFQSHSVALELNDTGIDECQAATDGRQPVAFALLAGALVLIVGGSIARSNEHDRELEAKRRAVLAED